MEKAIAKIKKEMEKAARDMDFIDAARLRDEMFKLQKQLKESNWYEQAKDAIILDGIFRYNYFPWFMLCILQF